MNKPGLQRGFVRTFKYWRPMFLGRCVSDLSIYFIHTHTIQSEAGAQTWVDAFLLCVKVMLSSKPGWGEQIMVINLEKFFPPITAGASTSSTLTGYIDYMPIVVHRLWCKSGTFGSCVKWLYFPLDTYLMGAPDLKDMKQRMATQFHSFLVLEAKPDHSDLNVHIPSGWGVTYVCKEIQVCLLIASPQQLYSPCLSHQVLRGVLTNGQEWIFIIFKLDEKTEVLWPWWQTLIFTHLFLLSFHTSFFPPVLVHSDPDCSQLPMTHYWHHAVRYMIHSDTICNAPAGVAVRLGQGNLV